MNKKFEIYPMDKKYYHYGDNMVTAMYNGITYEINIDIRNGSCLISENPINNQSVKIDNNWFETKVNLNDLDDIINDALYAEYKDTIFRVGMVSEEFSEIELISYGSYNIDVTSIGFKFNDFYRAYTLKAKKEDITKLLSIKTSTYKDILSMEEEYRKKAK